MKDVSFDLLIARIRQGDEAAASELVKTYEPEVRRFVRFRLTSASLRRWLDSVDVCQSVLLNFVVHVQEGRLRLDNPDQLRRLLLTMARNKLCDQARHERASRRDARRTLTGEEALTAVADPHETPSQQVAAAELVNCLRSQLSDDDLDLLENRLSGRPWADLAAEEGVAVDALRKRLTRALDRAAKAIGIPDLEGP